MSEQINIEDIRILESMYIDFVPLIEKMKSIPVVHDLNHLKDLYTTMTLCDKIVSNLTFQGRFKSKIFCYNDSEGKEFNHDLDEFRRVGRVSFEEYWKVYEELEIIKKASIIVDELCISKDYKEEFKRITDPIYFKNGINKLELQTLNDHDITDKLYANIKELNPKIIHLLWII